MGFTLRRCGGDENGRACNMSVNWKRNMPARHLLSWIRSNDGLLRFYGVTINWTVQKNKFHNERKEVERKKLLVASKRERWRERKEKKKEEERRYRIKMLCFRSNYVNIIFRLRKRIHHPPYPDRCVSRTEKRRANLQRIGVKFAW